MSEFLNYSLYDSEDEDGEESLLTGIEPNKRFQLTPREIGEMAMRIERRYAESLRELDENNFSPSWDPYW